MTEAVRNQTQRNAERVAEERGAERLAAGDRSDVARAADNSRGADVQAVAHNITGGRQPDAFNSVGEIGSAGTSSVAGEIKGMQIDRASNRLLGPSPGTQPLSGPNRTVYHFSGEDQARGMIRNGPRAGESGLAYFTSRDSPGKAGAAAQNAPFRLDVGVRGTADATIPYRGQPGQVSWNGAYQDALAQPGVNDQRAADAVRNRTIQDHLNSRPEERFSVRVTDRGAQRFEVYKPEALAGSQVDRITPVDNGRSIAGTHAGDARTGKLVANEILSGNADSARRSAQVAGLSDDAARNVGRAATASRYLGRALVPLGAALDAHEIATSDDKVRTGVGKAAAWTGAYAGAKGGAALGATIGAFGGPVGAVVGGVVGGVAGGIVGYMGGESLGQAAVDGARAIGRFFGWGS
jgi:hypothetical protein